MAIGNESNQMVLFLNLSDLLLRNQGRKDWKSQSFTTTDEGFLEKLRISSSFFCRTSTWHERERGSRIRFLFIRAKNESLIFLAFWPHIVGWISKDRKDLPPSRTYNFHRIRLSTEFYRDLWDRVWNSVYSLKIELAILGLLPLVINIKLSLMIFTK